MHDKWYVSHTEIKTIEEHLCDIKFRSLRKLLSANVLINILRKEGHWFCDQYSNWAVVSLSLSLCPFCYRLKALVSTGGRNVQAACDWWVCTHAPWPMSFLTAVHFIWTVLSHRHSLSFEIIMLHFNSHTDTHTERNITPSGGLTYNRELSFMCTSTVMVYCCPLLAGSQKYFIIDMFFH